MNTQEQNNALTAILIDDEEGAINVLSRLLERLGCVDILATESNPNLGLRHIMVLKPDLVFLDIQMDKKTGLTLLKEVKELSSESKIIIVSGYDDYTFEAFKQGATDYLVKPVVFSDLENAVDRIREEKQNAAPTQQEETNKKEVQIKLAKDKGYLSTNNILYLQASGSYTEIFTASGNKEVCSRGLWLLERELPNSFFRIHRSTVVNTQFIKSVSEQNLSCNISNGNELIELTVSKANIESLLEQLNN